MGIAIRLIWAAGGAIGVALGLPKFAEEVGKGIGAGAASTGQGVGNGAEQAIKAAALGAVVVVGYLYVKKNG